MLADRRLSLPMAVFTVALFVRFNLESIKPQRWGFIRGAHGSQGAKPLPKALSKCGLDINLNLKVLQNYPDGID